MFGLVVSKVNRVVTFEFFRKVDTWDCDLSDFELEKSLLREKTMKGYLCATKKPLKSAILKAFTFKSP